MERGVQLWAAIAFEAAEDVAGQALRMQAHQRRRVGSSLAQDQRDMLPRIGGAAKGDDLRILERFDGQARARSDDEVGRIGIGARIGQRQRDRWLRPFGSDQKGGKDACDPRQVQRGARLVRPIIMRQRLERPLHRPRQIERGIRHRQRGITREPLGPAQQHRLAGNGRVALIGEFQSTGAAGGNQQRFGRDRIVVTGLDRLQDRPAVQMDRPAMAQRIDALRRATRRRGGLAQSANSVTRGT